ncbi:Protein of unknown function [Pyronema omphalodes CBS 100304]|uniref:Uncharacterized protein n=1 Tax=Pyronema omphalodes (strain CBS 100304) TaxID=1076935 RepID=U4L7N2_PYROM|nr:Protein of unknown function [Pyronema omphalodes CBS 100304]
MQYPHEFSVTGPGEWVLLLPSQPPVGDREDSRQINRCWGSERRVGMWDGIRRKLSIAWMKVILR